MKAALAVLLVLSLGGCSVGAVPKPTATATLHWTTLPLILGGYCWSSGGQGECADPAPPDLLLADGRLVPYRMADCQTALIKFSTEPNTFDVNLLYSTTGKGGPVPRRGHEFDLASEPGTYVYAVAGTWPQGDVSFFLPLTIIPGCS